MSADHQPSATPDPSGSPSNPTQPGKLSGPVRVALLYKRNVQPDETLLQLLEKELARQGCSIFIDRHLGLGVEWAKEIERQIRTADAVVPLLSEAAMQSEMMGFEIEIAHEASQTQRGRPALLPIRVNFTGDLPEPMAGILSPIQYLLWEGPQDDQRLVSQVLEALRHLPTAPAAPLVPVKGKRLFPRPNPPAESPAGTAKAPPPSELSLIEPMGGAVPLNSKFYLIRPADVELRNSISHNDSIVLIKGARQMGKTSLLARGLQFARERGAKVVLTDFQKLNASNLESVGNLHLTLAESLADQLDLPVLPSDVWDERRGANVNFERYIRRQVLDKLGTNLIWGLDEVDRLFACRFGSEVFGLFRSWHNERALDPTGPWSRLTMAIAYATEAHLFITDINQSPFNVGTRLTLDDFYPEQVNELNQRYGSPLKDKEEIVRFARLVGGQPFLVRRGLFELAKKKITVNAFEDKAPRDEGIFGDHLRRMLVLLANDQTLIEALRGILGGRTSLSAETFYRLRSAGIVAGPTKDEVRIRCGLYELYLKRHLS
jgi:hypothetical protein